MRDEDIRHRFFPPGTGVPARHALLRYMEYWSEERYCAAWLDELELVLARSPEPEVLDTFRWLIGEASGWWRWDGQLARQVFVDGTYEDLLTVATRHLAADDNSDLGP